MAEVDVPRVVHRQVDAEHPLGDVSERQVGDPADALGDIAGLAARRRLVEHAAVGDDDALRVPRGARGVEHGSRVGGIDRRDPVGDGAGRGRMPLAAQRGEVRPAQELIAGRAGGRVAHDDLPQPGQLGQDRLPAGQLRPAVEHGDPGVAVGGHVADLVSGQGRVHGHRHSPGVHHRKIGQHVLGPVRQHQRDPLARLQAEVDQGGGELKCLLPRLLPGQGLPRPVVVAVGVRRLAAPAPGRAGQQVAEGQAVAPGRPLDVRPLLQDLCRHSPPPGRGRAPLQRLFVSPATGMPP